MGRRDQIRRARADSAGRREGRGGGAHGPVPTGAARAGKGALILVLAAALVLVALAYSNALTGRFVYDDERQIVGNAFIQNPQDLWKGMTSDVWAFKGERGRAWSNYWRPLFIALLALEYRLFGLSPAPWHVVNILLHALVTVLGFFVLRALGVRPAAAAIATWLFAAHPVHVESVTWVSGSPDLLVSCLLFGAYLCHLAARRGGGAWRWAGAFGLYVGAVLCKETAIVFPAIVFLTEIILAAPDVPALRKSARPAFIACLPYVAIAAVYWAVHLAVIGKARIEVPGNPGLGGVLLSAPSLLLFYVRQIVVPLWIGPSYGLRAVMPGAIGFTTFVAPAAILAVVALGAVLLARRATGPRLGLVWFLLPLAPVFDIRAFLPEDFVHDRYLYIPLFGALAFIGCALAAGWERLRLPDGRAGLGAAFALGAPLALLLVPLTRDYNLAWQDEVALWRRAVLTNPDSSFPHAQLGEAYRRAGRLAEARGELERALALNDNLTTAHISLGALDVREGRWADAERHLRRVLARFPDSDTALEQLALAYQQQNRLDEAIALFSRGRQAIPFRADVYTVNIAVLQHLAGRPAQAQAELESLRERLAQATDPSVLRAWFFLGEIQREQGRAAEAAADYNKYLTATQGSVDPEVVELRRLTEEQLRTVRPSAR